MDQISECSDETRSDAVLPAYGQPEGWLGKPAPGSYQARRECCTCTPLSVSEAADWHIAAAALQGHGSGPAPPARAAHSPVARPPLRPPLAAHAQAGPSPVTGLSVP